MCCRRGARSSQSMYLKRVCLPFGRTTPQAAQHTLSRAEMSAPLSSSSSIAAVWAFCAAQSSGENPYGEAGAETRSDAAGACRSRSAGTAAWGL